MGNHYTVKKHRSKSAPFVIIGAISIALVLTGCQSTSENDSNAPTSTATVETSATPTATKTAVEGTRVDSKKGPYLQKKLPENYPAYEYNAEIVDPAVLDTYTEEDVETAQKFVVDFIAAEGIDSKMNNAGQTASEWFEENKQLIDPAFHTEIAASLEGEKFFVVREDWQNPDYNYTYGEDVTRVANLEIEPTSVSLTKSGHLAVTSNVSYDMKVDQGEGAEPKLQGTTGTMAYSVRKDEATDTWLLTSFQHSLQTVKIPR